MHLTSPLTAILSLSILVLTANAAMVTASSKAPPNVLVYTRTLGYRHDSIPTAIEVLGQQAREYGVNFTFSEDPGMFVDETLARFDGVMFVSNSEEVLDATGQAALKTFFQKGGAYTGVHAASACLFNDTNYVQAVGALFDYHPTLQMATFERLDKDHPATAGVPDQWTFEEEVYYFRSDPRTVGASVIMTVNEGSYTTDDAGSGGSYPPMGTPHPIAWYIESPQSAEPLMDGAPKAGRSFYTSLGHSNETWHNATFIEHVMNGLTWALNGASTRAYGVGLVGNASPGGDNSTATGSGSGTDPTASGTSPHAPTHLLLSLTHPQATSKRRVLLGELTSGIHATPNVHLPFLAHHLIILDYNHLPSPKQDRPPTLGHLSATIPSLHTQREPTTEHANAVTMAASQPEPSIGLALAPQSPVLSLDLYPLPAFILKLNGDDSSKGGRQPPAESKQAQPSEAAGRDTATDTPKTYVCPEPSHPETERYASHPMTISWSNAPWKKVSCGRPLQDLLDRHTFASLEHWARDEVDAERARVFELQLGGLVLDLVKTPQTRVGAGHVVEVVITSTPRVAVPVPRMRVRGDSEHGSDETVAAAQRETHVVPAALQEQLHLRVTTSTLALPVAKTKKMPTAYAAFLESVECLLPRATAEPQCELLFEETDWSKTPLGPRDNWPPELTGLFPLVFTARTPDSIWIGKDLHVIYGNACTGIVDHPKAFGRPVKEIWASMWDTIRSFVERALAGEPIIRENDCLLFLDVATKKLVEGYHAMSWLPIMDRNKKVLGIYNQSAEITDRVLAQRRLQTTRELVEETSLARTSDDFFSTVAEVVQRNPADAPFMLLYGVTLLEGSSKTIGDVDMENLEIRLAATVGVPERHPMAPATAAFSVQRHVTPPFSEFDQIGLDRVSSLERHPSVPGTLPSTLRGYANPVNPASAVNHEQLTWWPIEQAIQTRRCVVVEDCSNLIKGFPLRQWDELPDQAIIVPICNEASFEVTPPAVMVLGLNRHRPLDASYDNWIQQLRTHLVAGLSSVQALETEIRRRLEKEHLERAQTVWFRGAAHEFRSPLTLIAGPLEDLSRTKLTRTQLAAVALAQRNVSRLTHLVNSFLDFTRMEAGRVMANFAPTDLAVFLEDIGALFRPAMEKMGIRLELDLEQGRGDVPVDPVLLEMVATNLLTNALRYTENGKVTIRLEYDDDYADISVEDTGPGIPSTELGLLTNWFHRTRSPDEHQNGTSDGTGIGIALVKEIVRLHGGDLRIKPRTQSNAQGSVVTARFWLHHESRAEYQRHVPFGTYGRQMLQELATWGDTDSDSSAASSSEVVSRDDSVMSSPVSNFVDGLIFESTDRLLIVDDDPGVRAYLKRIFKLYCTVLEATDGDEALRAIAQKKPHLVLCDFIMRRTTGLDILRKLRANPNTQYTPFVLLTALNDDGVRVNALVEGADDFIAKPFKPKELLLRVHLHMQMGKKRAKLEQLFTQREQEIAVLSDYCPSGILRTDADGVVTYVNAAFREFAGIREDKNINLWREHCASSDRTRIEAVWADILQGDCMTTNLQWQWESKRTVSGVFIRLDKMRPGMSGIIACVNDITWQEERLAEAERRRVEAEESRRRQELIVDLTSHEIRTPVSAILQCSSLVRDNLTTLKDELLACNKNGVGFLLSESHLGELEEDIEALESIYQCGLVQERIAGDILSLTRIQLNMLVLHDIDMDLRAEARKVLSVFASEARMRKIDITLNFGESLNELNVVHIKTDPVRLSQVVTNLVSNAIRFTSEAAVRKINVTYNVAWDPPTSETLEPPKPRTKRQQPVAPDTPIYLFVSVTDTGPGMAPHEKDILFRRFQQGNKMIHTRYGGSGLGLYICKKISRLLGGGISVDSELGTGSVFRFYIKALTSDAPAAQPLPSPYTNVPALSDAGTASDVSIATVPSIESPALMSPSLPMSPQLGIANGANATLSRSPLSPPIDALKLRKPSFSRGPRKPSADGILHVLVVEDNIINQTVLKRQLIKAGLTCKTANNGQEALGAIFAAEAERRAGRPEAGFDCVLMDVEMPVMDGLTAVQLVREAEARGELRRQLVIALTGNAREGQVDQTMAAGMDDIVIKPYRFDALVDTMRRGVAGLRLDELTIEEEQGEEVAPTAKVADGGVAAG